MAVDLQKASVWKRISAFLFDTIILSILVVGFAFLLSKITHYDSKYDEFSSYYSEYEQKYNVSFGITEDEFNALPAKEQERFNEASRALSADARVQKSYMLIVNLCIVIISISFLLSYLALEFFVPLYFKNGMTLGKKIFALGVMTKEGIRLPNLLLLARTLLGKYTIETMVPAFIIIMFIFNRAGLAEALIFLAIPLIQLVLIIATRTHTAIHDLIAGTVVVDFPSQRIFESREELIKYQEERARLKAEAQPY